jgi:hypothetical protein
MLAAMRRLQKAAQAVHGFLVEMAALLLLVFAIVRLLRVDLGF